MAREEAVRLWKPELHHVSKVVPTLEFNEGSVHRPRLKHPKKTRDVQDTVRVWP